MRIAIDAELLGRNRSGNEVYLRGVIGGLQKVATGTDEIVLVGGEAGAVEELRDSRTSLVAHPAGLPGDLTLGRKLRSIAPDVIFAHYNAPLGGSGRVATVIHDVSFIREPESFPTILRHRILWSARRSTRRSDLIVTVSQFSRSELLKCFPNLDPAHVLVTYNAAHGDFSQPIAAEELAEVRAKFDLPNEFVFGVGNLQPRKNFVRLAQAAAATGMPLVVAGQRLWGDKGILQAFDTLDVRWLGFVARRELVSLLHLCKVFAYPSLYEGFGLPVIEAMAAGSPVVTSFSSALGEVAGDAAVLVDPCSVDSIADGIRQVALSAELRRSLIARGLARAGMFTWEASARQLYNGFDRLMSNGGAA